MRRGRGSEQAPRVALRRLDDGRLDDVVVTEVEMFRMEIMESDDRHVRNLWLCCYLPDGDRITWSVNGKFAFDVGEMPEGEFEDFDTAPAEQGSGSK